MTTTDDNGGLWIAVSELARQKGIDKAAISRRIARFEAEGLLASRPGPRGAKLVNLAEYDRVAGENLDVGKVQAAQTVAIMKGGSAATSGDPVLAREQARRVAYEADLKKLDLGERIKALVPVDSLEDEASRLIEPIVKTLDRLPSHTEGIIDAHNEGGHNAVRAYLKSIVAEIRNSVAAALEELATTLGDEPRRQLEAFDPNAEADPDPS